MILGRKDNIKKSRNKNYNKKVHVPYASIFIYINWNWIKLLAPLPQFFIFLFFVFFSICAKAKALLRSVSVCGARTRLVKRNIKQICLKINFFRAVIWLTVNLIILDVNSTVIFSVGKQVQYVQKYSLLAIKIESLLPEHTVLL